MYPMCQESRGGKEAVPACGRELAPAADCHPDQYLLVRASQVSNARTLLGDPSDDSSDDSDDEPGDIPLGTLKMVPSVLLLNNTSFEISVRRTYYSTLKETLEKLSPGCIVDHRYNPLQPTKQAVKAHGDQKAQELFHDRFLTRAQGPIKRGWSLAADFYTYYLAEAGVTYLCTLEASDAKVLGAGVYELEPGVATLDEGLSADATRYIVMFSELPSIWKDLQYNGTAKISARWRGPQPWTCLVEPDGSIVDQCHHASQPRQPLGPLRDRGVLHVGREVLMKHHPRSEAYHLVRVLAAQPVGALALCNLQTRPDADEPGIRHVQPWAGGYLTVFDPDRRALAALSRQNPRIAFGSNILTSLADLSEAARAGRSAEALVQEVSASVVASGDEAVIQCYRHFAASQGLASSIV